MSGSLYVGIDLGTTNSTAVVFDGTQIQVVRNAQGTPLTPSVVRIDRRGMVTVGHRARRFLDSDPSNTRTEFKRLMGTQTELSFEAANLTKRPEALASEILRSLRNDILEQCGVCPDRAVITVPALFELPQTTATAEAARLAGFTQVELLQEPVASALAAGWSSEDSNGSWLVYDLGGGTFDVSLLETRDGLLRVVGHDGDNFLGGRDIDRIIVDWALEQLAATGVMIDPSDPRNMLGLRRLKIAAEEVKIELTRQSEAALLVPNAFETDTGRVDIELWLDRAQFEQKMGPLIDRSIAVCMRLLAQHGLRENQLQKIVLVGGPTVIPYLRERVAARLQAPFAEGMDPMTLVAQGAALYAATSRLTATIEHPVATPAGVCKLWLHYPAVSADLWPTVAGRLVEGAAPKPAKVRFLRENWQSTWITISPDGGMVATLELVPRTANRFQIEAVDSLGALIPIDPTEIRIVQGYTINDPPLSRTIGIALASDRVRVYLERGVPLPAKRTFIQKTVEALTSGSTLKIPIVQGEFEQAHLNRLVGAIEIHGDQIPKILPIGSEIEVSIEVDRGGQLSARAFIPSINLVIEQVATLIVPDAPPEKLKNQLDTLNERLQLIRSSAIRHENVALQNQLLDVEWALADAQHDLMAAIGGDADAAQRTQRALLDIDARFHGLELESSWPELEHRARDAAIRASHLISMYGTTEEQQLCTEAMRSVEQARQNRSSVELERLIRLLRELGASAAMRRPNAWAEEFEWASSLVAETSEPVKAQQLVARGREAHGNESVLRTITRELWSLLPEDTTISRRLGHHSGIR